MSSLNVSDGRENIVGARLAYLKTLLVRKMIERFFLFPVNNFHVLPVVCFLCHAISCYRSA